MTDETQAEKEPGRTNWDRQATFSLVDTALEEELKARRPGNRTQILGGVMVRTASNTHGCDGQLVTDVYFDAQEGWQIGISMWYECEGYLEILGSVALPMPLL